MIRLKAIGFIAYRPSVYSKRYQTRMERCLYDGYNSLPGELLTINARWKRVSSDKRILYGAQTIYHLGYSAPNYPVPAVAYKVCFYASGDCIEIRSWKNSRNKSLIDKVYWSPV